MGNIKTAVFAGGCFWCMVKPFSEYKGVLKTVSGYTGGEKVNPTYKEVCSQRTGHYEAVEITYDEDLISYEELVDIFFKNIDPTDEGGQFNDRGDSYRTAIFCQDEKQKIIAEKYKLDIDKSGKFDKPVAVQIKDAFHFYPAEEYHQDYYKKNSINYKMYFKGSGREEYIRRVWGNTRFKKEDLKKRLTDIQYYVTQENGTETPFKNEYYDNFEEGIYVDIVSGKPLFSSKDKFNSKCGWPSFAKPISDEAVEENVDYSHSMIRTEVRGGDSDAHLGHVFGDGPEELGGLRYCINSAALRFIPKDRMKEEGYGEYMGLL